MGSLRAFSARPLADEAEANLTREAISYLGTPAPGKWIAGRVVTLLSHYFVAQQEASIAEAVAEDWCEMLEDYPAWALASACRWWMSRENPRRHSKPLPGDIQDRAHFETAGLRAAEIMVRLGPVISEPGRDALSPQDIEDRRQRAAEIVAGFSKRVSA